MAWIVSIAVARSFLLAIEFSTPIESSRRTCPTTAGRIATASPSSNTPSHKVLSRSQTTHLIRPAAGLPTSGASTGFSVDPIIALAPDMPRQRW